MNCQFCGASNSPDDQFCASCGARIPVSAAQSQPPPPPAAVPAGHVPAPACQFCGAEIPAGDPFCGQCGARQPGAGLAVAAAPAAQQAWEAPRYAGFWIRFGAYLLDTLFSLLIALIPAIIGAAVAIAIVEAGQDPPSTILESDQQDEDTVAAAFFGFFIGATPFFIAYWWIANAKGGGWGKRICGIRIMKMDSGARPGYGSGGLRYLVAVGIGMIPLVGSFISLVDYLWMIWDKDKQTFHDKAAGTVVVYAGVPPTAGLQVAT